eukprot:g9433.t1
MPVKAPKFAASNWQEEVNELLETLKPNAASREQVEQIARAVKRSLGPVLPGAAVDAFSLARPMAGTAFGVAVPEVEVVVTLEGKAGCGTDRLVSQDSFKFRRSAFRGAEPKVTLITPPEQGNMPFNLAVNALMPARCSELFKACEMDPVAIELILLDRGISHAAKGHLSPYSWMLLAIYYLQGTHQLPAMSFVVSKRDRPEPSPEKNNVSAGELLQGFMKFYASFDWAKENISVRQGQRAAPTRPLMLLHEDGKTQPGAVEWFQRPQAMLPVKWFRGIHHSEMPHAALQRNLEELQALQRELTWSDRPSLPARGESLKQRQVDEEETGCRWATGTGRDSPPQADVAMQALMKASNDLRMVKQASTCPGAVLGASFGAASGGRACDSRASRPAGFLTGLQLSAEEGEDPCPKGLTNRFPDSLPKKIVMVDDENGGKAMNPMDSVFDLEKLRAALKEDPEWKIGMPWLLKATFTSDSQVPRTFGFASGDTGDGCVDIQATDTVEISGDDVEFQYKHPALWTSGKIVMSNICLAPRSCDNFECPSPAMKTLW